MSKRSVFTTITPLPAGVTRECVIETLHNHVEMIDLNPLVIERHICPAPRDASAEEFHCTWYSLTDRVSYLPGVSGKVQYNACFHDLALGVQTHVFAPLGLDIKEKWTIGGSLPDEPAQPVELGLGVPKQGLYLREDCDMRCNLMLTKFVRGTLTKAHRVLVDRLVEKAGLEQVRLDNHRLSSATATTTSTAPTPASRHSSVAYSDTSATTTDDVTTAAGFPSPALSSDLTTTFGAAAGPPPQYAELPPAKPPKEPHPHHHRADKHKRRSEPPPPPSASFAADNKETVPGPLQPHRRREQQQQEYRHSYQAYQPKAKQQAGYAAYRPRPPPPQQGYSAYRPAGERKEGEGEERRGERRAWIPEQPVELEG